MRLCCVLLLLSVSLGACLPHTRSRSLSRSAGLDSLAVLTAIQYGLRGVGGEVPLVCVSIEQADPRAELLSKLQVGRAFALRPGSTCHVDTTGGPSTDRSLVAERSGTGLRGISVRVSSLTLTAEGTATFRVSYYQHYLSSADWFCAARRREKSWVIDRCRLERIS